MRLSSSTLRPELADVHAQVENDWPATLNRVRDAVRMPSFSDTGVGIGETAAHFADLLGRVCPDAAVVATDGHPVVFGTRRSPRPGAPTLLIYGLYDVTPTLAEEWRVDPLAAEIRPSTDIGLPAGRGQLLIGRGVNNHKGPVIAAIGAIASWLETGAPLDLDLVFVIEGEEEIGSPSLAGFVAAQREQIGAVDVVWLPCMQQNAAGVMALRRGYKGCLWVEMGCRGGEWGGPADGHHRWAGHSAWIDAPQMRLVKALASLYDDDQRVRIDGVEAISDPVRSALATDIAELTMAFSEHPEWEATMLSTLGVRRALGGKPLQDHLAYAMTGVTLNIQGILGGYQGPTFYTMMPGQACARLDIRFPPGVSPEEVTALLRAHLDRRGFGEITLDHTRGYPGLPARPNGSDVALATAELTAARFGVGTAVWPMANNCCPAALFGALGHDVGFSVAGLGHGDRPHAPDEFITVDSVRQLMHFTVAYLGDLGAECAGVTNWEHGTA